METVRKLFFALAIICVAGCSNENHKKNHSDRNDLLKGNSNTDETVKENSFKDRAGNTVNVGKGSISTEPGGIESANTGRNRYDNPAEVNGNNSSTLQDTTRKINKNNTRNRDAGTRIKDNSVNGKGNNRE